MNITKKEIDANSLQLTLKIEKADYQEQVEKQLKEYKKKANMPGFRPGMVPLNLIKKMYGKATTAEAIDKIIVDKIYEYIKENNLNVLGQPIPTKEQKELDFDNEEDFEYSFDIGLAPEFEIELSDKDKIDYYNITISDEMIDNKVKSFTHRFGSYESMETAEENDMIKGDIEELEDGKTKEDGIKVQDGVLTPSYMKSEDEKKKFANAKVGDVICFNPKTAYENEVEISSMLKIDKEKATELKSDFQMTIKEITRYIPSELNQTLFDNAYGEGNVKSEDEFMERIKTDLQENLNLDSDYKFSLDAKQYYVNKYKDLTFPDEILKRWLVMSNKELDEKKLEEEYPSIIEDLTWQLIKDKITVKDEIKIEAKDVENYAIKVAKSQFAQYGMTGMADEVYANYAQEMMKNEESVRNFSNKALEEKVVDKIKATVTLENKEISIEDFNKLFETQEEAK